MDGTLAIDNNLNALKRILAGLVAMAGLGQPAIASRQSGAADGGTHPDCPLPTADCHPTLPRHLRLAILRLLRPAESAARRLIIAAARGLTVTLPPPRPFQPKPVSPEPTLRRFGIAVTLSPKDLEAGLILPRSRGRGTGEAGGGGTRRAIALPLFEPLRPLRSNARRTVPPHAAPRILLPGIAAPHPLPPPPSRDDPIDATRLTQRLAALAAALDDIEGQAERFARRQARAARSAHDRPARRIWPLRPGRPPGGRLTRYDPSAIHGRRVREVDEILAHAHALALHALRRPDTS
ncbi:hypothetical protein [Mesorhizobium sp. KR9-304]|uniref:hypothetical protein n=1 Tax=Mesorhizobium sp. KR9-304 TaxID=3156614 RepID=UPI0032B3ECC8